MVVSIRLPSARTGHLLHGDYILRQTQFYSAPVAQHASAIDTLARLKRDGTAREVYETILDTRKKMG